MGCPVPAPPTTWWQRDSQVVSSTTFATCPKLVMGRTRTAPSMDSNRPVRSVVRPPTNVILRNRVRERVSRARRIHSRWTAPFVRMTEANAVRTFVGLGNAHTRPCPTAHHAYRTVPTARQICAAAAPVRMRTIICAASAALRMTHALTAYSIRAACFRPIARPWVDRSS